MNLMIKDGSGPLTMSSRQIAELVEKRHDNVKRTVEMLAKRGVIEFPQTEKTPTATKPAIIYHLDERSSYILVAQLSPEFSARLVDEWKAMKERASGGFVLPDFSKPAIAAHAWANLEEDKRRHGQMLPQSTERRHLFRQR